MGQILAAVPSFEREWRDRVEAENAAEEPGGRRLHYLDVSDVLEHLSGQDPAAVGALLGVVERMLDEGDHHVRELATVGYLEDLQAWARSGRLDEAAVLAALGPESRRMWAELDRFWGSP